MLPSEFVD